ncbi:MAG: hypothetical protein A07HB70_01786 [uncultured archaeon A07HB70]|nr:MAG: hypothetical protein A07HB70_01786 [uncultured archaeon A07HB70]
MDDERVAVKTYVPAYQRETWRDHADDLGMSLSEFLRTMTQAGRRGFVDESAPEPPTTGADPTGDAVETLILDAVDSGHASWDDLVDAATDDVESRLDETLSRLQDEGRLRYSGREGGYVRTDG